MSSLLSWKQRLEQDPSLGDTNNWVSIEASSLPANKRPGFIKNLKIVSMVCKGEKIADVSKKLNVSTSKISNLMHRTLAGEAHTPPALTSALIPFNRLNKDRRRSSLSRIESTVGARCSIGHLLNSVPGLKNYLSETVKLFVEKRKHGENLTPKIFHRKFLQYLRDQNWSSDQYPFDQVRLGYESIRQLFHKLVAKYSLPKKNTCRPVKSSFSNRAYDQVQIDSQTLDIQVSIVISEYGETSPLRLSRMSLFIAIDVATDCILAYKLCLTENPTQHDLLDLLISINKRWTPRKLTTPGLSYEPGACLPTALGEYYENAGIGMISLDNALCHHSMTAREYMCNEMGSTIEYGLPAHPKKRNVVEYAFKRINDHIHRFSCTTGSHPNDDKKETLLNSKKPPILTLEALEDVLSVIITHHNSKPQNRLSGHSPLTLLQSHMSNRLIRINHHLSHQSKNPYLREKRVKVCWSSKEKRWPYVHFEKQRYSAPVDLVHHQVKQEIIIKYDFRDIRQIEAVTTDGKKLGILRAPNSWQLCRHNVDLRRYIMRMVGQKLISGKDPLHGLFEYLRTQKELPQKALDLTSMIKNMKEQMPVITPKNDELYSQSRKQTKRPIKAIKWNPQKLSDRHPK